MVLIVYDTNLKAFRCLQLDWLGRFIMGTGRLNSKKLDLQMFCLAVFCGCLTGGGSSLF
jgi:hypothetical protein